MISSNKYNIDIARKDYGSFYVSADYSSNVSTGDHLKFDSIDTNKSGDGILLDTTTSYTNAANVPSIGRFTLKAGRVYRLEAQIMIIASTTSESQFQWYDATNGVPLGHLSEIAIGYDVDRHDDGGNIVATVSPVTDILVELRITTGASISTIYGISGVKGVTKCFIYSIESFIPINRDILKAKYTYEKTSGTVGGTATATAWTKYPLDDSPKQNDRNFSSMASSVLTLVKGKYRVVSEVQFYKVGNCGIRLRNTSDSTTIALGLNGRTDPGDGTDSKSKFTSIDFEISSTKTFELQYYVGATTSTSDLGSPITSGENEVYGEMIIEKIG